MNGLKLVCVAAAAHIVASQGTWNINRLDLNKWPMARCLDGSPGAFYISPGSGADASKFVVHIQGGGWCLSPEGCAARAAGQDHYDGQPSLGSSTAWAATGCPAPNGTMAPVCVGDGGDYGALSADPTVNPLLHAYTKVFLSYCDGTSFAGALTEPVQYNSTTTLYFRGRYILDAMVQTLLQEYGMDTAPEVLIKGCSAGGMATFLHADRLVATIKAVNPTATVVAAPGAGAILYLQGYNGSYLLDPALQWMWSYANMSGSGNAACLAANPSTPHMCFYPQVSLPYINTPLFVANSLADLAQWGGVMGLGCTPTQAGSCNASQIAYLNAFRVAMISGLNPVLSSPVHGAWLVECFVHVLEDDDGAWDNVTVAGQTQRDTFSAWYAQYMQSTPEQASAYPSMGTKVVDGPWGTNPTCGGYTAV